MGSKKNRVRVCIYVHNVCAFEQLAFRTRLF